MKARTKTPHTRTKPMPGALANLSLGRLEISTEEILADLRYPAKPSRERRS